MKFARGRRTGLYLIPRYYHHSGFPCPLFYSSLCMQANPFTILNSAWWCCAAEHPTTLNPGSYCPTRYGPFRKRGLSIRPESVFGVYRPQEPEANYINTLISWYSLLSSNTASMPIQTSSMHWRINLISMNSVGAVSLKLSTHSGYSTVPKT